jgi:hypothetical protein
MPTEKQIRYATLWRNKWLTSDAKTLDDMVTSLREAADYLKSLKEVGFLLDAQGGPDDYMTIYTYDKVLADQFDIEEDEFWGEEEEEEFDEDEEDELEEGESDEQT